MKKMWMVVVVITTFLGVCACEKTPVVKGGGDDFQGGEGEKICNVENPLTDLAWLRSEVDTIVSLFQAGKVNRVSIYQCNYKGEEIGFLIDKGNIKHFYNCSGEILCIIGGAAGEMCPELNIVQEKLIWNTEELDVTISCNFEDPLIDLAWLKQAIESSKALSTPMRIYQCTYKNGIGFLVEIGDPNSESFSYILRSCYGVALCSILTEDYERYKIDFENKKLIWTRFGKIEE